MAAVDEINVYVCNTQPKKNITIRPPPPLFLTTTATPTPAKKRPQGFVHSGNWPTWAIETLHEAPARVTVTSVAYNIGEEEAD